MKPDFNELVHELVDDYVNENNLFDSRQLQKDAEILVDNGLGFKVEGEDYESSIITLQESSVAFLFMLKYNKKLKNYLKPRKESKYDDPVLSYNKRLKHMMFTLPSTGFYIVSLDEKKHKDNNNYMILSIEYTDDHYGYHWTIYFIGRDWTKYRDKYNRYKKKYQDEIKNCHYENIVYTDGTQPKEVNFKPFDKMVFSSKDKVLSYIDNWISHIPDYHNLNVPCKLSILLYGVPGTGKSTFAQALAKYMNIESVKCISPTYFNESERKTYQSKYNSCVYLLDDLDSFVFNRESEKADRESNNTLAKILAFLDNPPTYNYKLKDGRVFPISVVVATTNYFDKLDPAIKRYGRFDFQLEMTDLNEKEADELCHTYSLSLYDILDAKEIKKDALYSPAYIQALCLANLDKMFKEGE